MRQIRSVSCAHAAQRAPPARCSWRYSVNTRKRRRGHRPHPPHVVSGVKVPERRHRILAVDVNAQVLGPTSKWRCGGLVGASLPPLIAAIQFFCFTFCHSLRQLRILDGGILIAVCHSWLSMDTAPKLSSGRRPDSSPAATAPGPRTPQSRRDRERSAILAENGKSSRRSHGSTNSPAPVRERTAASLQTPASAPGPRGGRDSRVVLSKRGKLLKKRDHLSGWKSRYFVLDGKMLFYYTSQNKHEPKGSVYLTKVSVSR